MSGWEGTLVASMASQSDKWQCATCLVFNAQDDEDCIACELRNPALGPAPAGGTKRKADGSGGSSKKMCKGNAFKGKEGLAEAGAIGESGFTFSAAPTASSSSGTGFTFGAAPAAAKPAAGGGGFSFTAAAAAAPASGGGAGGFTFQAGAAPAAGGFTFGAGAGADVDMGGEEAAAVPNVLPGEEDGGAVYVFGNGDCGQLGLGEDVQQAGTPHVVTRLARAEAVRASAGGMHNAVLTARGDVYTWGCNDDDALGRKGPESLPGKVVTKAFGGRGGEPVVAVACGDCHTVALTADKRVLTWGTYRDDSGYVGYNEEELKQAEPTPVDLGRNAGTPTMIAAGGHHTLVVTDSGKLFIWGAGESGQLGRKIIEGRRKTGLLPRAVRLPRQKVVFAAGGSCHTLAVTASGRVYAWGLNNYGQLGCGDNENRVSPVEVVGLRGKGVVTVSAGEHHSLALTKDGKVYAFGRGDAGQLGLPLKPRFENTPSQVPQLTGVLQIAAGGFHSVARLADGSVKTWGYGDMAALGHGRDQDETRPLQVAALADQPVQFVVAGGQHTMVIA